ncbi:MAG: hypothetical protein IT564_02915 [Rhodospirillales bacterium]|nr:hypothetical protein [Rhodospirillales bacterium]
MLGHIAFLANRAEPYLEVIAPGVFVRRQKRRPDTVDNLPQAGMIMQKFSNAVMAPKLFHERWIELLSDLHGGSLTIQCF